MDNYMKLYNILMDDDVVSSINNNLGELLVLIPELSFIIGFEHKNKHHDKDVWEHTLFALSLSPVDFETRLVLLLHDIGKRFCFFEKDGERHYNGHPEMSYLISEDIVDRFIDDIAYREEILNLIKLHDTSIINRRDLLENVDFYKKLFQIQVCDSLAHHPREYEFRMQYIDKMKEKFDQKILERKI